MSERRAAQWLAAITVLVVLVVVVDIGRRSVGAPEVPPARPEVAPAPTGQTSPGAAPTSASTRPGAMSPAPARGPSHMEQVARADARRQIRAAAGRTYLNDVVAASRDSMLHRWDDRYARPVRIHLPRTSRVANFQPAFLDAIRRAFAEWEAVGLPVRFDLDADSLEADVHFFWRVQFDGERTGQTDLEWNQDGHLLGGQVTLATFDPDGQPLDASGIRVVTLHEIGHVLGLDHSPDSADLMHPVARVRQLSSRDVATAQLLYRLAPGSLR